MGPEPQGPHIRPCLLAHDQCHMMGESAKSRPTLCDLGGSSHQAPVRGILGKNTGVGHGPLLQGSSHPRNQTWPRDKILPSEPPGSSLVTVQTGDKPLHYRRPPLMHSRCENTGPQTAGVDDECNTVRLRKHGQEQGMPTDTAMDTPQSHGLCTGTHTHDAARQHSCSPHQTSLWCLREDEGDEEEGHLLVGSGDEVD